MADYNLGRYISDLRTRIDDEPIGGVAPYFSDSQLITYLNNARRKISIDLKCYLKQMYINAYQSFLFNKWLSKRIEISKLVDAFEPKEIYEKLNLPLDVVKRMKKQKHPFKLITGDLLSHYPYGKIFNIEDLETESDKFLARDRVPTGLLCGSRVKKSIDLAYEIEKEFDPGSD